MDGKKDGTIQWQADLLRDNGLFSVRLPRFRVNAMVCLRRSQGLLRASSDAELSAADIA